jgi:peptidoglycan/LPS O-acetylase OafA/YrhL
MEHPKYRPDIDGLRAVAILSVVLFHYFPKMMPGGYTGVDIFFVISGYLISSIIFKSLENHQFSFGDFYTRRIWRIFPVLLAVLSFALVFGFLFFTPDEFLGLGKHIAGSAAFISNFLLWRESGYFDISADTKPLLHLWSLGIEEQFYLIWPLIVWLMWKFRLNAGITVVTLLFLSFLLNIASISHDPVSVFYHPSTRFWELLAGGVLALLELKNNLFSDLLKRHKNLISVLGILLIILGFLFLDKSKAFPGWWALLPVSGSFFLIAAGKKGWVNDNILSIQILVFIGLFSFSLYLWHWVFLSILRIFIGQDLSLFVKLLGIAISFLFAITTYFFIEKPSKRIAKNKFRTLFLLAAMVLLGISGYVIYLFKGLDSRFDIPRLNVAQADSLCNGQWGANPCIIGNINSKKVVVIYGDSHAGHLVNAVANASGDKFKIIIFGQNCYSGLMNGKIPKTWGVSEDDCKSRLNLMNELAHSNIYAVIRSQRWEKYDFYTNESIKKQVDEIAFAGGLRPEKIILVGSAPEVNTYCEMASYYLPMRRKFCDNHIRDLSEDRFFIESIKKIALPKNIFIVDPYDTLCENGVCEVIHGQTSYYFDSNHLTTDGANTFTKKIIAILSK